MKLTGNEKLKAATIYHNGHYFGSVRAIVGTKIMWAMPIRVARLCRADALADAHLVIEDALESGNIAALRPLGMVA